MLLTPPAVDYKGPLTFSEDAVLASILKDSFYEFFLEFWKEVVHEELSANWHVKYLCDELQAVAMRVFNKQPKEYDLIINIPPGTTKSTICSQMFPAWCWTIFPPAKFIGASYAYQVSLKDSIRTRDIVESELYQRLFPYIRLREDQNTKGLFVNTSKGFRYSVGVGGAVTGFHGHILIVDDPIDPESSYSDADLKTANRWMSTTLPSRKINKSTSAIILVQQRLHQADPSGDMLEKRAGPIKHICLPGEISDKVSPPELKTYYKNGLLDPVRLSRSVLATMAKELGEYGYASQVQQDPVPLGGGMFKTDRLILEEHAPAMSNFVKVVRSWDKAGTADGGCYSVGTLMAVDRIGDTWVLDVVRGQWGSTVREGMIRSTAELDGEEVPVLLEIEGGSGGKESGENTVRRLRGFRVITYHPTGDKESRAYPFSSQVGGGTVHVLKRNWTPDFIEELRFFPHSRYKDQVDSSSAGFNYLSKRKRKAGGAW